MLFRSTITLRETRSSLGSWQDYSCSVAVLVGSKRSSRGGRIEIIFRLFERRLRAGSWSGLAVYRCGGDERNDVVGVEE